MLFAMGQYDDEIIELTRQGVRPVAIADRLGISRMTVYEARKKAGLVPTRKREVRLINFTPATAHQRDHAYVMINALERGANQLPVPEKTQAKANAFAAGLEKKVWLYDREKGFYSVPRREEHGDAIAIEV